MSGKAGMLLRPSHAALSKESSEAKRKQAQKRAKERARRLKARRTAIARPKHHRIVNGKLSAFRKRLRKMGADRERAEQLVPSTMLENTLERKSFEEQLHRLSSGYVYSEIIVPQYREFALDAYDEQLGERLSRRPSRDSGERHDDDADTIADLPFNVDDCAMDGAAMYDFDDTAEAPKPSPSQPNLALEFAEVHHAIEFPRFSDDEMRRRRREKWMIPVPEPASYVPEHYAHEDPTNIVLYHSATNTSEPPFRAEFHPGIFSAPAEHVHCEPRMIGSRFYPYHADKPSEPPSS